MNKQHNRKKQITVVILSALALCLAGGLYWYMDGLKKQQEVPVIQSEEPETEDTVTVPEISQDVPVREEPEKESAGKPLEAAEGPEETGAQEKENGDAQESAEETKAPADKTDTQKKASEGKPKSPSEAVPPSEPPADTEVPAPPENPDENGNCQPENVPQPGAGEPANGETRDGKIYIDGFGWVENHGGGSIVYEAPNAGTGEIIGEM